MADNKCKNEKDILSLAKSVIDDTIKKETNPIKDIFSYTFKESFNKAKKYSNIVVNYNSSSSSGGSSILIKILAGIVAVIIFIGYLIYYFIKAVLSYLENNLVYKFINIATIFLKSINQVHRNNFKSQRF